MLGQLWRCSQGLAAAFYFRRGGRWEWSQRAPAVAAGPEPGAGGVSWDSEGLGGHCEEPRESFVKSLWGFWKDG